MKNLEWSDSLRQAGAREIYFVVSVTDMPGQPFVVVPFVDGTDSAQVRRLFEGNGKGPHLFGLSSYATLHNAGIAGSPATLARVGRAAVVPRPELTAAFAACGGDSVRARLLVLPSADSRRVLEEMVPNFPAELGGGPITDLTQGIRWAAVGLELRPQPSIRLVVESRDAGAVKAVERFTRNATDDLTDHPICRLSCQNTQDPRGSEANHR